MRRKEVAETDVNKPRLDCAVDATMSVIEGKWKATIICKLGLNESMRFSELLKAIPTISSKVLTNQLKELERDGIVKRDASSAYKCVRYSLTEKGKELKPALEELAKWSLCNMNFGRVHFDDATNTGA